MKPPLFVELCAGTAALSLALHSGKHARPPVSRMGAKTGYAQAILRVLGLRPGQQAGHYLWCEPDAGVRLLLHAYRDADLAREAARIIRSWAEEEPRALWERLRAEGPARCPPVDAREVARCLQIIASNELINLDSKTWQNTGKGGSTFGGDIGYGADRMLRKLEAAPTLPATIHDDATTLDPREVARLTMLGQWSYRRGEPESGFNNGVQSGEAWNALAPETARRVHDAGGLPATIHDDATTAPIPDPLPAGTIVYMDPPYVGTTGYAHDLDRAQVVQLARRWEAAGATVAISEACGLAEELGPAWHEVDITQERRGQKRTFSRQQREVLTLSRPPAWTPSVQVALFGAA